MFKLNTGALLASIEFNLEARGSTWESVSAETGLDLDFLDRLESGVEPSEFEAERLFTWLSTNREVFDESNQDPELAGAEGKLVGFLSGSEKMHADSMKAIALMLTQSTEARQL